MKIKCQYRTRLVEVEVADEGSISQAKEAVSIKINIPPQYLRFVFRGRERLDDESLIAVGLKEGSRVTIVETAEHEQMVMAQAAQSRDADPAAARAPARHLSPQEAEALTKIEAVERDTHKLDAEASSLQPPSGPITDPAVRRQAHYVLDRLDKLLIRLDAIDLSGLPHDAEVRMRRKSEVVRINALCQRIEERAGKLALDAMM